MNRQLSIVATGFRLAGVMLGLASIAALVVLVPDAFGAHRTGAGAHYLDIQKYGLVGLLQNGVTGVGTVLGFFGRAATFVLTLLTFLFIALLVFAIVFYVTGQGLARRATWARVVAVLVSSGMLVLFALCLLFALHAQRPALDAIAALMTGMPLYAMWVLIWRFRRV